MVDIEELVSKAKAHLEKRNYNKFRCKTSEIRALLEAGATTRNINQEQIDGSYWHEVSYEGITFTNTTREPAPSLEKYSKKK